MKSKGNRQLGIVAIILGLALCVTGLWILTRPDQYRSTTRVQVHHVSPPGVFSDPWFIQTEYEKILSKAVLYKVIDGLNLNEKWGARYAGGTILETAHSFEILRGKLNFQSFDDTQTIDISVIDENPAEAAQIANLVAENYRNLEQAQQEELHSAAKSLPASTTTDPPVRIVFRATPPTSPIGHSRLIGGILFSGGVLVLALGISWVSSRRSRSKGDS